MGHLRVDSKTRKYHSVLSLEAVNNFETELGLNTAPGIPVCDVL